MCTRAGAEAALSWPVDRTGRIALAAHLCDQDDLHFASATHPGGVVWSAVAACSLERDVPVADAFRAAALGYELVVRLAEAAGSDHRLRWHATATAGTVGAAGAAAELLGGGEAVIDAVAHASSIAGGGAHAMVERTGTRFLHRAHATISGVACARAAIAGKGASRGILDEGRGTFALAAPDRLTAPRASTALEETGFRLHAATGFAHSAIDASLQLGDIDHINHVAVGVSPVAATLASNPAPETAEDEWWSIEHVVSIVLGADRRCVVVEPSASGWGATVEVTVADGSTRNASASEPHGHPDRPASDDDLCAKWVRLLGDESGASVLERIDSAEPGASFNTLLHGTLDMPLLIRS